jgi:hypothetical protein
MTHAPVRNSRLVANYSRIRIRNEKPVLFRVYILGCGPCGGCYGVSRPQLRGRELVLTAAARVRPLRGPATFLKHFETENDQSYETRAACCISTIARWRMVLSAVHVLLSFNGCNHERYRECRKQQSKREYKRANSIVPL